MTDRNRRTVQVSISAGLLCALTLLVLMIFLPSCTSHREKGDSPAYAPLGTSAIYRDIEGTARAAIPGSLPSAHEELWIIQKAPKTPDHPAANAATQDDLPTTGTLITTPANATTPVPIPLKHTNVNAAISGYIASVHVTQQFHNPYDGKIEAVYVFPLPENAGVSEFVMAIGERKIRGIIRDRAEAEKLYEEAKSAGHVASLLTQERPNIFTQKVANIEPGKAIDIHITYFHTLAYADGWYEWVFPMVVGPRYNPAGTTDGIGAAPRGVPGATGQKTEVQYLAPSERSGHDIALAVDLDAGVAIESLACNTHKVTREDLAPSRARIAITASDTLPNKDFVLRWKVAGDQVKSALIVHRDQRGGFFTLMIYPPSDLAALPRRPVEMIFVFDTSGSMSGQPIEQAKSAMRAAMNHMVPGDTFQVVRFASSASQAFPQPVPVSRENAEKAIRYVNDMNGSGGTEMIQGIRLALDAPRDPERTRVVPFMTDGYIGNERHILRELREKLAEARVFSFGVGDAPNRYLLSSMARVGNGAVAYLGLQDDANDIMKQYFDRIAHPALANLHIDYGNMQVTDVFPARTPDLFVGRPVIITGRFAGKTDQPITIKGTVGRNQTKTFQIASPANTPSHPGLPVIWARMKIADLHDHALYTDADIAPQVKQTALDFGILSAFTAFIAVDSTRTTEGAHGTTVAVPVPVPEGVRYDTTVQPKSTER